MNKVLLKKPGCALDMGDGSERGLYVSQDYILQKMRKIHRGISLMYTYYPNDKEWPTRACKIDAGDEPKGAWDSPYENYFPYRGGKEGLRDDEPFKFMKEIRQRGQDVVLTLTIDPTLTEEELIPVAKDLRPYGRILLRVNHECTGTWFCFNRRASYEELAAFFVRVCKVMHQYAPNVKVILCAGMWQPETGKLEMEDIFLEAHKVADIWSGDQYLSLHWGWPVDVATKKTHNYACYDVDAVYDKAKNTYLRLKEITGQDKPMVLSELNGDGDVTGAFEQSNMMKHFMERLQKDPDKWLSAFTLYQFRDDGRLGLEVTDPNNSDVGIEQPMMAMYKEEIHKPFYTHEIETAEKIKLPAKLRWGGSEDAEGVETDCHFNKTPTYFEVYFENELKDMNIMMEFGGYWFYKAPGVKCIDLMSYFFENPLSGAADMKLRFFCPPKDGMNKPENGDPYNSPDGDWMTNSYTVLPKLPTIRIEEEPVSLFKHYDD
ncbi:MAG: hypothetical protein MJ174_08520 [Treponema sp.]|nr:hypothetical protein [Treponema sp.]